MTGGGGTERFFRELTVKRIRRDAFARVPDLIAAIEDDIDFHNDNPKPFKWTTSADAILEKVECARATLLSTPSA